MNIIIKRVKNRVDEFFMILGNPFSDSATFRRINLPVIHVAVPNKLAVLFVTNDALAHHRCEIIVHLLYADPVHDDVRLLAAFGDRPGVKTGVKNKVDIVRGQPCSQRHILVVVHHEMRSIGCNQIHKVHGQHVSSAQCIGKVGITYTPSVFGVRSLGDNPAGPEKLTPEVSPVCLAISELPPHGQEVCEAVVVTLKDIQELVQLSRDVLETSEGSVRE